MSSTEKIIDVEKMENDYPNRRTLILKMLIVFIAEFIGTGTLLFVGCMGAGTNSMPHLGGLSFGLAVLLCVQLIGHISGAHLNPQVSLAAVITGNIPLIMFPVYLLAEFVGAIAGYGLLMLLWPINQNLQCVTLVHPSLTTMQAIGIEGTITFLLVLAVCAVWDIRHKNDTDSTAIRLGLVIGILAMAGGSLTGASMNSARSFGPALLDNDWSLHWVYWVGPTLGGLIASVFYKFVLGYEVK